MAVELELLHVSEVLSEHREEKPPLGGLFGRSDWLAQTTSRSNAVVVAVAPSLLVDIDELFAIGIAPRCVWHSSPIRAAFALAPEHAHAWNHDI